MILQCPRCHKIKIWDRDLEKDGPGFCICNAYAPWNVLKKMPETNKGHVIVMSDLGWQELHGPFYKENPDAWKKD